jgi:hypothetical protein
MPALSDDKVLNIEGYLDTDPARSLRLRAQQFITSRRWSTSSIFYGDQAEPADEPVPAPWSFCFNLGLDHIHRPGVAWRKDVEALVRFLETVLQETESEILMEVRYRSQPWHSEHIAYVDGPVADVGELCDMVERVA